MRSGLSSAAEVLAGGRPLCIAHRGDSKHAPENTLPAFDAALALGVDCVEIDFHASADGTLVVIHDADLRRTTDAFALWGEERLRIADRAIEELSSLDAGVWFGPQFRGTRLPSLIDSLRLITPHAIALIERKSGDAETLCRLLRHHHFIQRVIVQSFDWGFLAECRQIEPGLILAALGEKSLTIEHLDATSRFNPAAIGWDDKTTDAATIAAIHAHAMKALIWTVDSPVRQRDLLTWGVDGIITNDPATLLATISPAARK